MLIADVSQFNVIKDWSKVMKSCNGLIVRLGYRGYGGTGKLVLDKNFVSTIDKINQLDMNFGVYFVSQAINNGEAKEEAEFVHKTLLHHNTKNLTLGIWFDSEYCSPNKTGRGDKISKQQRTANANIFCSTLLEKEYKLAGVYCAESWYYNALSPDLIEYPFWIARYGLNNGKIPADKYKPTMKHMIWQYTSKGSLDGINGNVDLNEPYDNFDDFKPDGLCKSCECCCKKKYQFKNCYAIEDK